MRARIYLLSSPLSLLSATLTGSTRVGKCKMEGTAVTVQEDVRQSRFKNRLIVSFSHHSCIIGSKQQKFYAAGRLQRA